MDVAAVIISIVALLMTAILAGFGILLQWLMSKDTRDQATKAEALLGEIRGLTTTTRETQERQFETVLQAAVKRTTEATTSETAEILQRIDGIEGRLRESREPPAQATAEFRELRGMVEALKHDIPRAVEEAGPERLRVVEADRASGVQDVGTEAWGTLDLGVQLPFLSMMGAGVRILVSWLAPPETSWAAAVPICQVQDPLGVVYSAKRRRIRPFARVSNDGGLAIFTYPDDFPGAEIATPGLYRVFARVLVHRDGERAVSRAQEMAFEVVSPRH